MIILKKKHLSFRIIVQCLWNILYHWKDIQPKYGDYTLDSSNEAQIGVEQQKDKHYHYIVLDNTIKNNNNTVVNINEIGGELRTISYSSSVSDIDKWGLPIWNRNAKPLAKYGNMKVGGSVSTAFTSGCKCVRNCAPNPDAAATFQGPISWVYPINIEWGAYCQGSGATGGYILSGSSSYKNSSIIYKNAGGLSLDNYIGRSSWNMDASVAIETGKR